jgi:hypothetical protein
VGALSAGLSRCHRRRRVREGRRLATRPTAAYRGRGKTKRPRSAATATPATDLSTPERVLLFCVASDTEWERAGITGATVTAMIVRGLIEQDAANRLALTEQGGRRAHGADRLMRGRYPIDPMTLGNMRENGVRSNGGTARLVMVFPPLNQRVSVVFATAPIWFGAEKWGLLN